MLYWSIKHLSPRDYGDVYGYYTAISFITTFLVYGFHFWRSILAVTLNQIYTLVFIKHFIYEASL